MENEQQGIQEESSSTKHRGILIAGLLVAMLFSALDSTIVGTAMPRIIGELGGMGVMAWLTTAYMLTSTTVVPIAGKLADLLGRKVVYITGLVLFMIGSILCGMTESIHQLIIFRGVQGIGGGIMMPMAMIIIGDIFTGAQRAKWQGVFGGIFGLATILGPQVGGWIVDAWNWRWVFYINLPVGILATVLIYVGLHNHKAKGPIQFDISGMVTMVIGVVSLLLALTFGGDKYEWGSWQLISLMGSAIVFLTVFVFVEKKAKEPILPMHLFKNKTYTILNAIGFLMSIGMFGATMFIPFFMQGIIGMNASQSGSMMIPMMLTMMAASMIGGQLVRKIGIKRQIFIGMFLMGVGFYLMSTMNMDTTKLIAMIYMGVLGIGMGLVMPVLTLALQESFPKSELGVVTSSNQFFRQIGGTVGITILGAVMNHKSTALLTDKLVPVLNNLPTQAAQLVHQFKEMIVHTPQSLYSMLFSPEALAKIPSSLQNLMLPTIKGTLVDSLHVVFLTGLIFIGLGMILTLFLGKIELSEKEKKE